MILIGLAAGGWKIFKVKVNNPSQATGAICPGGCDKWNSRVVAVHDNSAVTSGTTIKSDYYNYADQTIVDSMVNKGILALTGKGSIAEAWTKLLPCGNNCAGKKIGIKVNWNNSRDDYGNITRFNPLPQTIIALLKQLVNEKKINESDIYIYDCSERREFYSYFTDKIWSAGFKNVYYLGNKISSSYGVKTDTPRDGEVVNFDNDARLCAQLKDTFDYIINVPLLRAHGEHFGFTLSFKNHFGSITKPSSINHNVAPENLLVPLNNYSYIKDKTVLIMGDGLYGGKYNNMDPPNKIYETLFFATDPVAADSVMLDHLKTFINTTPTQDNEKYLHTAAGDGSSYALGVHEHWDSSHKYGEIDYVYCDSDCPNVTVPTTAPTFVPTVTVMPTKTPIPTPNIINKILQVLLNFGGAGPTGDFNGDQKVNALDFAEII